MKVAVAGGTGVVGRHVVDVARERGHDVDVLTRSTGIDLVTGTGLADRLYGVDAVIDTTSVLTMSAKPSTEFFRAVTRNLLRAGEETGVRHHVALSIIGVDEAPYGYYAGKAVQEDLVGVAATGTVVRAAQFHEFAEQNLSRAKVGPVHVVPTMHSQPVAAREVAELLVDVAEASPRSDVPHIAGPEPMRVADMVRQYLQHTGRAARVLELPLPGAFGRAMRDGTLLPGPGARLGRVTYGEWLEHTGRRGQ